MTKNGGHPRVIVSVRKIATGAILHRHKVPSPAPKRQIHPVHKTLK